MKQTGCFADGGMVGLGVPQQQGQPFLARYADGGVVGGLDGMRQMDAQGTGQAGMQGPAPQLDAKMADMHIAEMYQQSPETAQAIQQVIQQGIASGEITPQEFQMAVQLARAVLQNPALWPQLRQFAVQQGLVGPSDLPQQYDQSVPLLILTAAKAVEASGVLSGAQQGQVGMMQQPGMQNAQAFANGGMIVGPGTGRSDSIDTVNQSTGEPVKVSNGEYIIPSHVVEAKGKDFFDSLLRKYAPIQQGGGK
jgi:hypothetical protein